MSQVDAPTAFAAARYRLEAERLAKIAVGLRRAKALDEANEIGKAAFIALNASRCEVFDPVPPVGDDCKCETCQAVLFAAHWRNLTESS